MLFMSLAISAFLLIAVNFSIRSKYPVGTTLSWCGGFFALPIFFCFGLPAVALQAALLVLVLVIWRLSGKKSRVFSALSAAATLAAYAVVGWLVWEQVRQFDSLREKYPYESMAAKLPPPKPVTRQDLPAMASESLVRLEEKIDGQQGNRPFLLERLHEHTVTRFVNSRGFGVGRMILPSETWLEQEVSDAPPAIANPVSGIPPEPSPGEVESDPYGALPPQLLEIHEESVVDFVFVRGFGFVKDRQRVAGFLPHRFSQVPQAGRWKVRAIDLVSLLLNDPPVAYVSKDLPRMDKLRKAPTRPLDGFESVGLEKLRSGDDYFARTTTTQARMLGALRAAKQCVACHDCERGDLLGAFSYALRRE